MKIKTFNDDYICYVTVTVTQICSDITLICQISHIMVSKQCNRKISKSKKNNEIKI